MTFATPDNEIKKTKCHWGQNHGNHLVANTFGPSSGNVYLTPIDSPGDWRKTTFRYKYDYTGAGTWSFNFFIGTYRMMRGTGGTAGTLVNVGGTGSSTRTSAGGAGTEYTPQVTGIAVSDHNPEAIYMAAFLWVDTSTPPNRSVWTSYGTTFPSFADWFYYSGSSGNTSLPATIAAPGAAAGFQIYVETQ